MDTKSCDSHATTKSNCQHKQGCASSLAGKPAGNGTIWIVALDAHTAHVFLQYPGQPIEPLSMGCCCRKKTLSPESLAEYLDTALAAGDYTGLVLVGSETMLKTIKRLLSPAVHNRMIAEIEDNFSGKSVREVAQGIAARMPS